MRSGYRLTTLALALVVVAGCGGRTAGAPIPTPRPTAAPSARWSPVPPGPSEGPAPSPSPTGVASPIPTPSSPRPSPTTSSPEPPTADRPVIVIDPGHSGRSIRSRTTNGLLDFDYPNYPEITEAFDISTCVANGLRADGYRVIMTKKRVDDSVSLTQRARIANRAKADLAISVHDDHRRGSSFQATYGQRGVPVAGRYPTMYRGTGSRRTVFDNPAVAKASERAAKIIARERTRAQGHRVGLRQNSFDGRAPLEPGNLALVQLLSEVPWVYNEAGARTGGGSTTRTTLSAETGYAEGLLNGVEAAVPVAGRQDRASSATALRSCLLGRRSAR